MTGSTTACNPRGRAARKCTAVIYESVEKCSTLNPLNEADRTAYLQSVERIIAKEPEQAQKRIYPVMGAYVGEEYHYLLHQCLCFQPSLSLVRKVYESWPQAIQEFCHHRTADKVGTALPLHCATYFDAPVDVICFLASKYPEAAKMGTKEQRNTPLHLALQRNSTKLKEVVKILVRAAPSSLLAHNKEGTPIHVAITVPASMDVIRYLANLNPAALKTRKTMSPSDRRCRSRDQNRSESTSSPLRRTTAAAGSDEEIRDRASSETNVRVLRDDVAFPLMMACFHRKSYKILSKLIKSNPTIITTVDSMTGKTFFQDVCAAPGCPCDLLETMLDLYTHEELQVSVPEIESHRYYKRIAKALSSDHSHIRTLKAPSFPHQSFTETFLTGMASNTSVETLCLSHVDNQPYIKDPTKIAKAMKAMLEENQTIKALHLHIALATTEVTEAFLEGFAANNTLEEISIVVNASAFTGKNNKSSSLMKELFRLLVTKSSLRSVSLRGTDMPNHWDGFCFPMDKKLLTDLVQSRHAFTALHLYNIRLHDSLTQEIAKAIRENTESPLREVTFSRCHNPSSSSLSLDDSFIAAIETLLQSPTLEALDISGNFLGNHDQKEETIRKLAQCLQTNDSLKRLDLTGNHHLFTGGGHVAVALKEVLQQSNYTLEEMKWDGHSRTLDYYTTLNRMGRVQLKDPNLTKEAFVKLLMKAQQQQQQVGLTQLACYELLRGVPHVWA